MELEFHQLELRYDRLRIVRPDHERRLLSSLAEVGQQVPIVVVKDFSNEHFVVIDGYQRVRSLRRLGRDTVGSLCWECSEAEALVVSRLWHTGESETALEQSWLLVELHERIPTVPGRAGPSLHSLGQLGQQAPGPGARTAGIDSGTRASRRDRGACRRKVSGSFGARQPASLSPAGRRGWFVAAE